MTNNVKHNLMIALLMVAGVVLIALSLPHDTEQMATLLSHEVGKPWRNPTLIAPFDIPIEYDQVTKDRITDSVNANFVHFYKLDNQLGEQKLMQLNKALSNLVKWGTIIPTGDRVRSGYGNNYVMYRRC